VGRFVKEGIIVNLGLYLVNQRIHHKVIYAIEEVIAPQELINLYNVMKDITVTLKDFPIPLGHV